MTIYSDDECMNDPDFCKGELIEDWSSMGTRLVRCVYHYEIAQKIEDGINERYPYHQPPDFDPDYAGERWDDDY